MVKLIPSKDNLCSRYATKMLSIKLNSVCNCSCNFCVDRGGRNTTLIDVKSIADEAINLNNYKTVIITGGEPFLNFSEVVELLKLIRPYKDRIVLNTNGSLLTSEKVEILNEYIDELQVSIHHYDENINAKVFHRLISFEKIKDSLKSKKFKLSINSTFNNSYFQEERIVAVDKLIVLCKYFNADNLRLTELKKVDNSEFVSAKEFFKSAYEVIKLSPKDLIVKGCTYYYSVDGINISVKRLCSYAKGKNAKAFSCCFIDTEGQNKIDVETEDTFKVIYSDGLVTNDWVFNNKL